MVSKGFLLPTVLPILLLLALPARWSPHHTQFTVHSAPRTEQQSHVGRQVTVAKHDLSYTSASRRPAPSVQRTAKWPWSPPTFPRLRIYTVFMKGGSDERPFQFLCSLVGTINAGEHSRSKASGKNKCHVCFCFGLI